MKEKVEEVIVEKTIVKTIEEIDNKIKNQHFLPVFYLKKFSLDKKTLKIYNIKNKREEIVNIRNFEYFSDDYAYENNIKKPDNILEILFSKYEQEISNIFNKVEKNLEFQLTFHQERLLRFWVFLSKWRTKSWINGTYQNEVIENIQLLKEGIPNFSDESYSKDIKNEIKKILIHILEPKNFSILPDDVWENNIKKHKEETEYIKKNRDEIPNFDEIIKGKYKSYFSWYLWDCMYDQNLFFFYNKSETKYNFSKKTYAK